MSDVNLVFTVNSVSSTFTVDTTTVNVTPNTTAINMFAGYAAYPPNGVTGNSQVLFNDAGLFGGDSGFTYDKSIQTASVKNLQISNSVNLGSISNVSISGGTAGQYIASDGVGGIVFDTLTPGGLSGQLQFNDANNFGGIANVTFTNGNLSLGNVANVKLQGGTNGYVLQTDGVGNLTWTAQIAGEPGNGSPGGANTQIQYNNAGLFGGSSGFTFDNTSNTLAVENITANNVTGTLALSSQQEITTLGSLTSLTVEGTTKIQQGKEKVTIVGTAPSGSINFDVLNQAIVYYTANAIGNISLNIRGNSTATFNSMTSVGESVTITTLIPVGSTVYTPTQLSIDSVNVSPRWSSNVSPTSPGVPSTLANTTVSYTYTIIKTASNTYSVLSSFTGYK